MLLCFMNGKQMKLRLSMRVKSKKKMQEDYSEKLAFVAGL